MTQTIISASPDTAVDVTIIQIDHLKELPREVALRELRDSDHPERGTVWVYRAPTPLQGKGMVRRYWNEQQL
jgi:hypothetical protein